MECVLTIIVQIKGKESVETRQIIVQKGDALSQSILNQEMFLQTSCGGKGSCGKCRVLVQKGDVKITKYDRSFFSAEDLEQGYRLGCKVILEEDCTIYIPAGEFAEEIEIKQNGNAQSNFVTKKKAKDSIEQGYGVGIDFGTTTIAMELVDLASKEVLVSSLSLNSQRQFGADVITRIEASNTGKKEQLRLVSKEDVSSGILALIKAGKIAKEEVKKVVISGNTVMMHLFMGYSVEGLGRYPFTPFTCKSIQTRIEIPEEEKKDEEEEEEDKEFTIPIFIIPAIGPFVGGDITAGIQALHMCETKEKSMLIDLGTNGEIVLWDGGTLFATSTAVGPAFEGVGIFFGMGNVDGAINKVIIDEKNCCQIQTIHNVSPKGICGSGILSILSQLRQKEIVDETGLMREPYFSEGFPICKAEDYRTIVLTQSDIRRAQMAKAAIRAGIESILFKADVKAEEINTVYLAGGFGNHLSKEEIDRVGILPRVLIDKIQFVGNTSLQGAVEFLLHEKQKLEWMKKTKGVELATEEKFNALFFDAMNF